MAARKKTKGRKPARAGKPAKSKGSKAKRKTTSARPAKKKVAKVKARPASKPKPARKPAKTVKPKPAKKVAVKALKGATKKPLPVAQKAPAKALTPKPKPAPQTKPPTKAVAKLAAAPPVKATPPATPAPKKPTPPRVPEPKAPVVAVMTNVDPLSGPVRTLKKALKERFTVEMYIHSTPFALYEMISTPSGLSKWFCDDVNVRGEEFTFLWGLDQQTAEVLSRKQGELIRLHWKDDDDEGSFFELRIRIDPLTNEVALVVTDHAWPNEMQKARQLWESQVHTLQRTLGA
jgi:uncharacterized protein YndB with AHSA1/START domain